MELKKEKFFSNITKIEPNSIAHQLGIQVGDLIISVNDKQVEDIIEYDYLTADEYVELAIKDKDGQVTVYEIEKDYDEKIGIEFENPIMNNIKTCSNKCIFCFVDQLPKGMRRTLYIKDDDSRLSFLQGNFITLTNLSDKDMHRIIDYHISPINISIHATDEKVRSKMLGNKLASKINDRLKLLKQSNIKMNCQIVLIPEVNDGDILTKTLKDLEEYIPQIQSVAIVPVGVTKYRDNLPKLNIFDEKSSYKLIEDITKIQDYFLKKYHTRFVFLSDEFYVMSGHKFPEEDEYEGFIQHENGVGMIVKHYSEFSRSIRNISHNGRKRSISIATGKSAYKYIAKISREMMDKFRSLKIKVYQIDNDFFGRTITVTGLLTGGDLYKNLQDKPLFEQLILCSNMFKSGEEIFLDDMTKEDLEEKLGIDIKISQNNGKSFVEDVLGI